MDNLISGILILLSGSITKIFSIKSLAFSEIKLGNIILHSKIFSNKISLSLSSNGKYPHNMANNIIPVDQISILNPLYFFPPTISGEA